MNTSEKTESLNQQLKEIDGLQYEGDGTSSAKFVRWREATKRRIKSIFGEGNEHYEKFSSISYLSGVISFNDHEQRQIDHNAFVRGLSSAKNQLLVMIDELSEMPDEEIVPISLEASVAFTVQPFPELEALLGSFRKDYPNPTKCAFIMMQFTDTRLHREIVETVKSAFATYGITALRADDKSYSDDLLPNVRAYMHGCGLGIAIFERLTSDIFNPNVSLEVGYMMALGKPTLLLKDTTLSSLPTDLVGRLYKPFDTQNPRDTIPPVIEKWLREKSLN